MFSLKSKELLNKMRVNSEEYYQELENIFQNHVKYFNELLEYFDKPIKYNNDDFNYFYDNFVNQTDDKLRNYLYELYKNLCQFYDGGVWEVFKRRDSDWGAPRIYIQKEDTPNNNDIDALSEEVEIYRGCSKLEYNLRGFTQSWTTSLDVAVKFAKFMYHDLPEGVVVKAKIPLEKVIDYNILDSEKEVIIEQDTLLDVELVDISQYEEPLI